MAHRMKIAMARTATGMYGKCRPDAGLSLQICEPWEAGSYFDLSVVANAAILNWRELARLLDCTPAEFLQLSIPERVGSLYLTFGSNFVELLEGSFVIAVWDERSHQLTLAGDRFGIQRVYWQAGRGSLSFASHPAALEGASSSELNCGALLQYLIYGTVPAPLTIYSGTHRLRPGFLLTYNRTGVRVRQYWDLKYCETRGRSVSAWAAEARERLRCAVARSLDSCGAANTGAFLSGGTDSSAIVAFMSERISGVSTFSVRFEEPGYNEIAFANVVARQFAARHTEALLTPGDALDSIPRLAEHYQEPFGNSSAIAAYHCARAARSLGIKTLLAGDGGDEIFAGNQCYARERVLSLYDALPPYVRLHGAEPLARFLARVHFTLPQRYISRAGLPEPVRHVSYNPFLSFPVDEVFEPGFLAAAPREQWFSLAASYFSKSSSWSWIDRLLYHDMKVTLGDNDLLKVTGSCELAGVAVRFPMLDPALVEFTTHLPASLKVHGLQKRYIFKKAMAPILPRRVLHKKKHGFAVPMGIWLVHDKPFRECMEDLLSGWAAQNREILKPSFLVRLVRLMREDNAPYYGEFVWRVMALELWRRAHSLMRGPRAEEEPVASMIEREQQSRSNA